MARKIRKKPGAGRPYFLAAILVILIAIVGGYRLYTCLFPDNIRLNYIMITKNGEPLKILQGETVNFHPTDICKIREISTNICFNHGIRLVSTGMDIDELLYEETALEKILPDNDAMRRHRITVEVKYKAETIGKIELIIEPRTDDWIEKAKRSIGNEKKIEVLERAVKEGFDDKRITGMLADEYIAVSAWNKAAALLEKNTAESADKDDLEKLLKVYEAAKNNAKITDVLNRLIKINPEDLSLTYKLAEHFDNTGKKDKAIIEYNKLLPRVPEKDRAGIYKTLGYLYSETKQTKNAINAYLKALESDKKDINLYYNLSALYESAGDRAMADKYLGMAIQMKPDDIDSRLKMAEDLIGRKEYAKAESYLKEVTRIKPDSADAWLMLANIEEKRGNKKLLEEYYKKILSIAPDNKTVIFNLGALEYETGNLKSAKGYFEKYLKTNPGDVDTMDYLFDIYKKEKNDKSAFEQALKILDKNPEKTRYYGFVFDYLNRKKDYKSMSRIMEAGFKKNPGNSEIMQYLIIARLNTGRDKDAVSLMERYLKKKPNDVQTLMQLAALYEKLGRIKDALGIYKKVLGLSPDNEAAQDSYLRLRMEVLE